MPQKEIFIMTFLFPKKVSTLYYIVTQDQLRIRTWIWDMVLSLTTPVSDCGTSADCCYWNHSYQAAVLGRRVQLCMCQTDRAKWNPEYFGTRNFFYGPCLLWKMQLATLKKRPPKNNAYSFIKITLKC